MIMSAGESLREGAGCEARRADAQLDALQRRVFGKKSERRKPKKLPPPVAIEATAEETAKKRADAHELRNTKLVTEIVPVPVPKEQCTCQSAATPSFDALVRSLRPSTNTSSRISENASIAARLSPADAGIS